MPICRAPRRVRKCPQPNPTWPIAALSVAHDFTSHEYVRLTHMSLREMTVLVSLYAIVLAAFLFAVHYYTIRPFRKVGSAKSKTLPVPNLAGLAIKTFPDATAMARPTLELSRTSRMPQRNVDSDARGASTAIAAAQIKSTTELPAKIESLPTFNEVWAKNTAVKSHGTTVERTLTVKELPTRMLSPVLLPAEKDLLPEGLRTLEVSPNRTIEPGTTVYAAFTFRNLGGAAATGFRVRFRLPVELAYVEGTARIDGDPLADQDGQTPFLGHSGAEVGDIPAGGERRLSLAYRVADVIEDGSVVVLQAAIASASVRAIGTNIVRLTVRSAPVLQSAMTFLTLSAKEQAAPGDEIRVNARIHNSGQSTAHDVTAFLPVPAHTTFVPQSATIGGRSLMLDTQRQSFGTAGRTVAQTLQPGETVDIAYRVRIDSPLEDATVLVAGGTVCSQEVGQFALAPVSLEIGSAAAFDSAETSVRLECANDVRPGETIRIAASAKNVGTAVARGLSLTVGLPDGLSYIPGSLSVDGTSTVDHTTASGAIALADLAPGETVTLSLAANVRSPIADQHELAVLSALGWTKGKREFERKLTTRSAPRFPLNFNKLERIAPFRVAPADALAYHITLHNMGTDTATQVKLEFLADTGIERLRLRERDTEHSLDGNGTVQLGAIEPGMSRAFRIDAQVAPVIEDQTELRLRAALTTAQTARVELGAATHVVDSAPKFSVVTSRILVDGDEPLEHRGLVRARLILVNEGTDRGNAVRAALLISDDLEIEHVDGEPCANGIVEFGDIPAGERREAELHLRLAGSNAGERVRIGARLSAANVMAVNLAPVEVDIHAEPSFEQTTLSTIPSERVDAGAEITYTLAMRNSGNGRARHLTARLTALTDAVYAQGSTSINGIALQDQAGTSLLLIHEGLTLADVAPGVEAVVRWRAIVNTPLPPSTAIEAVVSVQWDDASPIVLSAEPLLVQSTSAMPVFEPSLPFSVLGAVAASKPSTMLTIPANGATKDAIATNGSRSR
jgi:uncharacterized repeat protein (TIGR01451 family)